MLGVIKMSVLAALVITQVVGSGPTWIRPSAVKLTANDVANIERTTGITEKQPQAQNQTSDVEAIKAAKNTNVRLIERTLPDKRFDQWLRDLVGRQAQITWEVNDCGEQTGDPLVDKGRDFPMCAEAQVTLGGKRKLFVELCVGTFKTGVRTGPATLFYAIIVEPDGSEHIVKTLSGLPEAIKAK